MKFLVLCLFLGSALALPYTTQLQEQGSGETLLKVAERLNLKTFVQKALKTEVSKIVNQEGPFTVFAPNDTAFEVEQQYPTGYALNDAMLFHVGRGKIMDGDITNERVIKSLLDGRTIRFNVYNGGQVKTANGRRIMKTDNVARNGVVHVVGGVMSSIYRPSESIATEIVNHYPQHSTFMELVKMSKLIPVLSNMNTPMTLFAPTNEAMSAVDPEFINELKRDMTKLRATIMGHIVKGTWFTPGLISGQSVRTEMGVERMIQTDSQGVITVGEARITLPDIVAANGAVHSVDKILITKSEVEKMSNTETLMKRLDNYIEESKQWTATHNGQYWRSGNNGPEGQYWRSGNNGPEGQYWRSGNNGPEGQYWSSGSNDQEGQYWRSGSNDQEGQYWRSGSNDQEGQYWRSGNNGQEGQYYKSGNNGQGSQYWRSGNNGPEGQYWSSDSNGQEGQSWRSGSNGQQGQYWSADSHGQEGQYWRSGNKNMNMQGSNDVSSSFYSKSGNPFFQNRQVSGEVETNTNYIPQDVWSSTSNGQWRQTYGRTYTASPSSSDSSSAESNSWYQGGLDEMKNGLNEVTSGTNDVISALKKLGHHEFARSMENSGVVSMLEKPLDKYYTLFAPSDEGWKKALETSRESEAVLVTSHLVSGIKNPGQESRLESLTGNYIHFDNLNSGRLQTYSPRTSLTANGVPMDGRISTVNSGHVRIYSMNGGFNYVSSSNEDTVMKRLMNDNEFSKFVSYAKKFGFTDVLDSTDNAVTVLAPTNEAITEAESKYSESQLKSLLLGNHIAHGSLFKSKMVAEGVIKTMSGERLEVNSSGSGIELTGGVHVVQTDISASNGVIHKVDKVIPALSN